ncbi:MAG: acyl-CoA reductase [Thermoguttaceae bacterium]|jgi:hypothetical protein
MMKIHLLFDRQGPRIGPEAAPNDAPLVDDFPGLVGRLRAAQETLAGVPAGDLIGLLDAAARAWTRPEHPLADFLRRHRLGFLPLWMRRGNLESLSARSLRGRPEALDEFVRLGDADPMRVRAQPRGLVVHWLAGNVPVLGMLSLVQSLLCKNANLLKVSHRSTGLLPHLLAGLTDVVYANRGGEALSGRLLTDAVAVVYADKTDEAAARELSLAADVRVAWGGQQAVEAIVNLPRKHGTEDIVFGPKTSLAVIATERLGDTDAARRVAAALAADASAFDQQGCNSPHTVFVERGAAVTPADFAKLLAEAMETECRRSPLEDVDPAATMNVLGVRAEYAMRGEAYGSRGMGWTVVYAEDEAALAEPCFQRTLFVRGVDDVFGVVPLCSRHTQTVGLAVDDRRLRLAGALSARGVDRCPPIGAMRLYEAPWDGLFPMDRLVRWVSTY